MRRWIGVGAVLIAIGIAGLLSPWSNWRNGWDTLKVDEQSSIAVDGVKRIVVHTDSENVRLVQGVGSNVNIHVQGKVSEEYWDSANVKSTVENGTLDIRVKSKDAIIGINIYSLSISIEVPWLDCESLEVKTDSGDIALNSLKFDDLKLSTDSGDFELNGMVAKTIALDTDSGDAVLQDTEGALVSRSDSGDLLWNSNQLNWAVDIKSDSGDVTYNLDQEPDNATIQYESDSGDGVLEWGDKKLQIGSSLSQVYGSGALPISVKTDSGDLTMKSN